MIEVFGILAAVLMVLIVAAAARGKGGYTYNPPPKVPLKPPGTPFGRRKLP